jgi:hypothetical protein
MDKPKHRHIMRIELAPDIMDALDEVILKNGSTSVSVISRLVKWVADQDEETQAVILGIIPGETSPLILQRTLLATSDQDRPTNGR